MTTHEPAALVIELPSVAPAAMHNAIVKGIISTLKFQMQSPYEITVPVKEGNYYLLTLLEQMLPNEHQLASMHVDSANPK